MLSLLIIILLLFCGCCNTNGPVQCQYQNENVLLKIASVSPNGEYAIVNFCEDLDTIAKIRRDYLILPVKTQVVVDIVKRNCWQLIDTTTYLEARNFAWSQDSKYVLFSVAFRQPEDTSELFPVYVCELRTRKISDVGKPWLSAVHYNIPLFSHRASEIILWAPGIVTTDTLPPYYANVGRLFRFNMLQNKVSAIAEIEDITWTSWMRLHDTTELFVNSDRTLRMIDLHTGKVDTILPRVRVVSTIGDLGDTIVFAGRIEEDISIYIYDLSQKVIATTLDFSKGSVLSVDINKRDRLAVTTVDDGDRLIYVVSKDGAVLDSLRGHSPYWLGGSDSLIYSEGKKINLACWHNNKLEKKTIFEIVKKK